MTAGKAAELDALFDSPCCPQARLRCATGEVFSRLGHRRDINVGQIYATLDRLGKQGLLASSGTNNDGLPLYELTSVGRTAATEWLSVVRPAQLEWNEMLDQPLVASSIPGVANGALLRQYRGLWAVGAAEHPAPDERAPAQLPRREREQDSAQDTLATADDEPFRRAALHWLGEFEAFLALGAPLTRAQSDARPRRGRRPAA